MVRARPGGAVGPGPRLLVDRRRGDVAASGPDRVRRHRRHRRRRPRPVPGQGAEADVGRRRRAPGHVHGRLRGGGRLGRDLLRQLRAVVRAARVRLRPRRRFDTVGASLGAWILAPRVRELQQGGRRGRRGGLARAARHVRGVGSSKVALPLRGARAVARGGAFEQRSRPGAFSEVDPYPIGQVRRVYFTFVARRPREKVAGVAELARRIHR
mmetsp:Transcript_13530/g.40206  ORF Transcript_13530/g.40206 Transcript_13530/m.40206 type:complete len:212 (+) Transcript_13530:541-1176(+)